MPSLNLPEIALTREPAEGAFYECFCVFLVTIAVRDDQLIEIPRKQFFKRSAREFSICKGQPDIESNATIRRGNALEFDLEHCGAIYPLPWNESGLNHPKSPCQIVYERKRLRRRDDCLSRPVGQNRRPGFRRLIRQHAGQRERSLLQSKKRGSRRPQLSLGE